MRDLFTGRLTWRQFGVLIRQLPHDSRLAREIEPDAIWRLEHQLLATLVDAANVANWQRANSGRKKASRPPEPIARPGVRRKTLGRTSLSNAQVKEFLARFNPPALEEEVTVDDH